MTAIDDLRVGNWIVITHYSPPKPIVPEGMFAVPNFTFIPDGTPLRVRVISLPFIIVTSANGKSYTLYTPLFRFQKVTKAYVDFHSIHITAPKELALE
jgi:hypothetical protein